MATEYVYLSGKAMWPRLATPDDKYNCYSISVVLDKASRKAYDKSGIQVEPRTDEEGNESFKFRCDAEKLIKGELVKFDPPKVYDKDLQPLDPFTLGNGSTVTVKLAVYQGKKGKGHRLMAVRVDKLVTYERPASDDRPF